MHMCINRKKRDQGGNYNVFFFTANMFNIISILELYKTCIFWDKLWTWYE